MFHKYILTFWLILLFSMTTYGQSGQDYILNIDEITIEEGLTQRKVICIHEDDNGFLWMGGDSGLLRYDGQSFKSWNEKDSLNLLENITSIEQDDSGWFWLWNNTLRDFVFFHPFTEQILTKEKRFSLPHSKYTFPDLRTSQINLSKLILNDKNQICFGLSDGKILTYDKNFGFQYIQTKIKENIKISCQDSKGNYWVIARYLDSVRNYYYDRAIYKISPEGEILIEHSLDSKKTATIFSIIDDTTYIHAVDYSLGSMIFTKFKLTPDGDKIEVEKENGFGFGKIADKFIWVVNSRKSWEIFDLESKKLIYKLDRGKYPDGLYEYSKIILVDSRGFIWISSNLGLFKIHFSKNKFKNYFSFEGDEKPYSNSVRGIYADENSVLMSCEVESTIKSSRSDSNDWSTFSELRWGRPLIKLDDGQFCIGYESKIVFYSASGEITKSLTISQRQTVPIWCFYYNHSDRLWIGGSELFYEYNYLQDSLREFKIFDNDGRVEPGELKIVYNIIPEGNNKLWLCTNNGLRLIDIESQKLLEHYGSDKKGIKYLPSNTFYHLHKDNQNVYWLSSPKGLIKWDPENDNTASNDAGSGNYLLFDHKFGLPNEVIYAVFEDEDQRLWMSSNSGIISFDKQSTTINSYTRKDGTASDEFNKTSFFKDKYGTFYFGGLNGVTSFHPNDFTFEDQQHPKLLITEYEIFDGDLEKLVNKSGELREKNTINFYPNDRYFKLSFELATFNTDSDLSYAWKIDGMHNDWIYQDENTIQIGMLPYGKHKLSIKGKSSKTGWSTHQLSIDVAVYKPFYLQTWFILLSLVSIISGVVGFFKIRTRVLTREIAKATQKIQSDKQIIEQQAEDLLELDKVKSRFFANVSHELRTPLSLMLGPMKDLLKGEDVKEKERKLLDLMHRNTLKLRSIVNELLDLSKLENKKMDLEPEVIEFFAYIENYVKQYESFGSNERLKFKSIIPKDIKAHINLDKSKFEKIINNFFSNAVKFTPEAGQITVKVDDLDPYIQIAISDTGLGIDPRDLPHVFDRFYQSKRNSTKVEGGTGIGLAFCKELAELMDGEVWAESLLGKGSTFFFKFKKNVADINEITTKTVKSETGVGELINPHPVVIESDNSQKEKKNLRILIAEDNPDLRAYYQIILEKYEIITFEHGKAALDHLSKSEQLPDLIISDLMMPVMDGLELITKLKSNDSYRHIPLIVLTAKTDRNIKIKALRVGIDDYINKPFDSEELLVRIGNIISRKEIITEEYDVIPSKGNNPTVSEEEMMWLESLESIIINHIDSDILTLNYLCAQRAMSPSTLQRHLKKLTGLTAAKYIQEHRLNYARELLQNRKYKTIAQVAYHSGFKEPNSFARSFKNRFGVRPKDILG